VEDAGFANGCRADPGEHATRAYNEGLVSEPPARSRGRALSGGQVVNPLKLKAFFVRFHRKGPKVKVEDLDDSSLPCPKQTASRTDCILQP